MVDKEKLKKELIEKFEETKKELGFSASFEEIEKEFFIVDGVLEAGYVSDRFDRQLPVRMTSLFYSWISELHSWLMPPMGNLISNNEAKTLTDDDKKLARKLIMKAMYFLRKEKISGIKRDKKEMGKIIDEMLAQKKEFFEGLTTLLEKTKKKWEEDLAEEETKK